MPVRHVPVYVPTDLESLRFDASARAKRGKAAPAEAGQPEPKRYDYEAERAATERCRAILALAETPGADGARPSSGGSAVSELARRRDALNESGTRRAIYGVAALAIGIVSGSPALADKFPAQARWGMGLASFAAMGASAFAANRKWGQARRMEGKIRDGYRAAAWEERMQRRLEEARKNGETAHDIQERQVVERMIYERAGEARVREYPQAVETGEASVQEIRLQDGKLRAVPNAARAA